MATIRVKERTPRGSVPWGKGDAMVMVDQITHVTPDDEGRATIHMKAGLLYVLQTVDQVEALIHEALNARRGGA